jgi:type IV fimbrial biogenesis protein FimT
VRPVRAGGAGGFTLVEAAVVVAVIAILVGVATPGMSNWLLARKATAAAVFYKEGLMLARSQAVSHNSASRLVLVDNANGQVDWRVDICFPTDSVPCNDESGAWSTTSAAAGDDPDQAGGFRSVLRSAGTLPNSNVLASSISPLGATEVVFTPLGWVDSRVGPRLERIALAPAQSRSGAFRPLAVALTLAGVATICDPAAAAHDPRGCPP